MIFKQIREFFIFSHKERNGLLILVFILLITVVLDFFVPLLIPEKEFDPAVWKDAAEKQIALAPTSVKTEVEKFEGFFDPNDVGLDILKQVGVPPQIASNWVKYTQKGGRFYKKVDVMKLYGMNEDLLSKIERHLLFPDKKVRTNVLNDHPKENRSKQSGYFQNDSSRSFKSKAKNEIAITRLDLNVADSVQLEALPGIGGVLASRIVKYRKLLGGFYEVVQLKEIYGMSDESWVRSSPRLLADTVALKKLDLNFMSFSELGRHPYIGFRQAKKIVKIRDKKRKVQEQGRFDPVVFRRFIKTIAAIPSDRKSWRMIFCSFFDFYG